MSVCPYCDKPVPAAAPSASAGDLKSFSMTPADAEPTWRPFCSQRCKLADLGQWFSGAYAIPGETGPESPVPDPTPLKPQ